MSMFDNYDNLNSGYIPNNENEALPTGRISFSDNLPRKEYNIKGEFIGYSWRYGDTLTLTYTPNKTVYVEADAIVYSVAEEAPTTGTEGLFGQYAYNTVDLKVWKCTSIGQSVYTWELQEGFAIPENGTKAMVIPFPIDLTDKFVKVTIYDYNRHSVYSKEFHANSYEAVTLTIDEEVASVLIKGTYTCEFSIEGEEGNISTFHRTDEVFSIIIK